eukprot:TRINITY_DN33093_c0_g1_i1.p3 TRINITY_DN33093_c0_g1~~TRINITY_DN33093_c0_g1_i1.p3  ORF type:complete len:112 (+),score=3.54 TRINITY_DN33093_c0_g1_i1:396-731(+)
MKFYRFRCWQVRIIDFQLEIIIFCYYSKFYKCSGLSDFILFLQLFIIVSQVNDSFVLRNLIFTFSNALPLLQILQIVISYLNTISLLFDQANSIFQSHFLVFYEISDNYDW